MLEVPVIVLVHGEGGSGGALGIAVGDRILMHEFAIYSVIPPEGCAAILWRDAGKKVEAAEALKITAPDLLALGIIDEIVLEPVGGAHTNPGAGRGAARRRARHARLPKSSASTSRPGSTQRYQKFRKMGSVGIIECVSVPFRRSGTRAARRAAGARVWRRRSACRRSPRGCWPSAGSTDPDEASRFLNPSLDQLHDPFRLAGLECAVDRLLRAIASRERIAMHGDYDVDGITSTVILRRALELLGADVGHFIPERLTDGYGLQPATIDRLHAEGVKLIVSVDCGIRGAEAARRARELGVDLIITDHHEPDAELPDACAVVNPKRHDCTYPDKNLAGVGVALKLVQALCQRTGKSAWLPAFVKIAAIGTLADVVPLVGENRVIAKLGLQMLTKGPHKVGLRALFEAAGLTGKTIDSYHIGFMVAPRINAAGRMSTPDIATRLLLASDEGDGGRSEGARRAARGREHPPAAGRSGHPRQGEEDRRNRSRDRRPQRAGGGRRRLAPRRHRHRRLEAGRRVLPAGHRVVDRRRHRARILPQHLRLRHAGRLESCAPLMRRFGGHKAAAGLQLETSRIKEFRQAVNAHADTCLGPDDLRPRLWLDGPLAFSDINERVMAEFARAGAVRPGQSAAAFHTGPVSIVDGPRHPEGTPPQDEHEAERPRAARHPVERRRARTTG